MGAVTTRALALRETATRPSRMHAGREARRNRSCAYISIQEQDPAIQGRLGARKTTRRGNKTASLEKINDIVYQNFYHIHCTDMGCQWPKTPLRSLS
ncbi:hypothetical protein PoB_002082000 [Plakobranchus ocellatus]|uniref:Uncharacterized protein n=1 Tax=Plakobranchus ocellatus TaxID=259542 RepID=A0AAV3ZIB1_9GAST|nr:hypothetical protein PoB_002082000 [Plakobranchus ocellatus]